MQTWLGTLAIMWSAHGNTKCDMSSHGMPLSITNPNNECLVQKKKQKKNVCIQAYAVLTLQHLLPLNHLTWNKTRPYWANYFGCPWHSGSHISDTFRGCFCPAKWTLRRLQAKEFIRITVIVHELHCHLKLTQMREAESVIMIPWLPAAAGGFGLLRNYPISLCSKFGLELCKSEPLNATDFKLVSAPAGFDVNSWWVGTEVWGFNQGVLILELLRDRVFLLPGSQSQQ